jgi:outer membrane protein assembly factor BamB
MINRTFFPVLAIGLAFNLSSPIMAKDWPNYRGASLDGKTSEPILRAWPSDGLKNSWRVPLTDGFSSFTTGGGKAFTLVSRAIDGVKRETVVALDVASGKESWAYPIAVSKYDGGGDSGTPENKGGDGPRSTPSFLDGRVYVLSFELKVVCLDASSGKEIWVRDVIKQHAGRNIQWQNAASPAVFGKWVFVAGGGAGQALLALDRVSGVTVWKSQDDLMTHATPVVTTIGGQEQVIYFTQSGLVALNTQDGKLLWRHPFKYSVSTAASPVVSGDIVYCTAGYGVGSTAVRVAKSGDQWTVNELWRTPGNKIANHWSTPVAHNGYLYGMFSFKEYGNGPLKCVELETGKEMWSQPGFGAGNVILADGQVMALGDAGQLVLMKPDPKSYREVARMKSVQGKCWSTPIVSNGKVFVRSTKEGAAFDIAPAVSGLK